MLQFFISSAAGVDINFQFSYTFPYKFGVQVAVGLDHSVQLTKIAHLPLVCELFGKVALVGFQGSRRHKSVDPVAIRVHVGNFHELGGELIHGVHGDAPLPAKGRFQGLPRGDAADEVLCDQAPPDVGRLQLDAGVINVDEPGEEFFKV